jgi:hypothetical protein
VDRVQDGAARDDEIGTSRADAGMGGALGVPQLPQLPRDGLDDLERQRDAVHLAPVVAPQAQMDRGQRGDRAGGAEHLQPPHPRRQRRRAVGAGEALQHRSDHPGVAVRVGAAAEALRKGDHAQGHRERMARLAAVERRVPVQPQQLRAAAADVEHQELVGVRVDQRQAAQHGEPGLLVLAQHLELDAGDPPDAADEVVAVLGPPAGLGGHAAHPGDTVAVHDPPADLERGEGAPHGALAQPVRAGEPLAETDDAREAVDDVEAFGRGFRHEEAAIVGAEVERGQPPAAARQRLSRRSGSQLIRHKHHIPILSPRL